ncbi:glycosyltransferase [Streptomyces sp. SP2-10]|uniref:glycosyltransferase n=1 Tax=Streptomyces sp. SP2-10 TaxID=2873385 RepID=UPI001CA776A0|nr:hypothetical protein [Streptomyces sp. SP2-10]
MAELLPGHRAGLSPEPAGRYDLAGFVGPELPDVPALADVVISRSGAGTPAELTALGKSALSVPLAPSAGDEQAHNARHLQEAGIGIAHDGDVTADQVRTASGRSGPMPTFGAEGLADVIRACWQSRIREQAQRQAATSTAEQGRCAGRLGGGSGWGARGRALGACRAPVLSVPHIRAFGPVRGGLGGVCPAEWRSR